MTCCTCWIIRSTVTPAPMATPRRITNASSSDPQPCRRGGVRTEAGSSDEREVATSLQHRHGGDQHGRHGVPPCRVRQGGIREQDHRRRGGQPGNEGHWSIDAVAGPVDLTPDGRTNVHLGAGARLADRASLVSSSSSFMAGTPVAPAAFAVFPVPDAPGLDHCLRPTQYLGDLRLAALLQVHQCWLTADPPSYLSPPTL